MRPHLARGALAGLVLIGLALGGSRPASAVYECGGVRDTCTCGRANFCICCSSAYGTNSGNCVWWAWHQACCRWNVGLQWCTNAETFDDYARNWGYPVQRTPCANTIFVCERYTTLCGSGSVGHVGWVTSAFPNGSIDVTEQGCSGWYGVRSRHFDAQWASPPMDYILKPGTSCGSNCECTPGHTETRSCCDCGTRHRTCGADCQWRAWSACAGPDPPGAPTCDTGEDGVCAAGRMRCVEGCQTCLHDQEPSPERCDALDNDCDGETDEGFPVELGEPPPRFAAQLVDFSYPRRMASGSTQPGWAVFENVGLETWPMWAIWLSALAPRQGSPSALHDPDTWPAYDVLAWNPVEVPPGETVEFHFTVRLSSEVHQEVVERFQLEGPTGNLMQCPAPQLELAIAPARQGATEPPVDGVASAGDAGSPSGSAREATGCAVGGHRGSGALGALALGLFFLGWRRRRRRRL